MSDDKRALAAIGYIPPLFFIPLFLAGDDELAKFHGRQALVLVVVAAIIFIAFRILNLLLGWIPPIHTLFSVLEGALYIVFVIISVIAAINAARGELWRVPILGAYSDRLRI